MGFCNQCDGVVVHMMGCENYGLDYRKPEIDLSVVTDQQLETEVRRRRKAQKDERDRKIREFGERLAQLEKDLLELK
jgi:hypothetical protein